MPNIESPGYYVQGVLNKNRRIIAKTITVIESTLPFHQDIADKIINMLLPHTGNAFRIGIAGVPGAGKSTFIETFGMNLIKANYNIAVLAIDPSSPETGGSILGDKTRMEQLSSQAKAYIRPSPSGESINGIAKKTRETMLVCEAAGFDVIVVETVGTGQSGTTVASMVDFFLVLMLAGAGDELQGIKKGVIELADLIAINKADGNNIENTEKAKQTYETAMHLLNFSSTSPDKWKTQILTCSAIENKKIDEIWETIVSHRDMLTKTGEFEIKRRQQSIKWMHTLIKEELKKKFYNNPDIIKTIPKISKNVENGIISPSAAAKELLSNKNFLHNF